MRTPGLVEAATKLRTTVNRVEIDIEAVSEEVYAQAAEILRARLGDPNVKNREAICETFLYALNNCPGANASGLWHHLVYRLYCEILPESRHQDPGQSWVRASGDALEIALEKIYSTVFAPHNITITALISRQRAKAALKEIGLENKVGDSKLDMVLRVQTAERVCAVFGGVHVKASLAERVSDDVPCSRAMMAAGYFSPLWTLDVKSFPPPGDLVNRGELGTPARPSDKRKYVEVHGDFDHCYSANARTAPSVPPTQSGKLIFGLELLNQPDPFAAETIRRAQEWLQALRKQSGSLPK
ncbi:MAG: BsaWI family type II restriction enzyme [Candidatus Sulfotelmatobacter sp.]